jgi:hypothetical protein
MVATYQVKPYETQDFVCMFQRNYAGQKVTVTIDAPMQETQQETNARILQTAKAENSKQHPYKVISMGEMDAMMEGS